MNDPETVQSVQSDNSNFVLLNNFFEAEKIGFTPIPDTHLIQACFGMKNTSLEFVAFLPPNEGIFKQVLILPVTIPASRRPAVGEFLHRVNATVRAGGLSNRL
jgi:hypothetical protein